MASGASMRRRRFVCWIGLGLFGLGEKLRADGFDALAARLMRATEPTEPSAPSSRPEHWTVAENNTWRWFEREHLIDGHWKLTGITTPIHKGTGERYTGRTGYLDDSLVPAAMRRGDMPLETDTALDGAVEDDRVVEDCRFIENYAGQPN